MRRLLLGMIVLCSAACLENIERGASTINGAYTLRTVNGAALPYRVVVNSTTTNEIIDDEYTLYQGGTYSRSAHSRTTTNAVVADVTITETGAYSLLGSGIYFKSNETGLTTSAMGDGNSLTISDASKTMIYKK